MKRHFDIYMDNNATTPLASEVVTALSGSLNAFGNPSSRHRCGEEARDLVERARAQVAHLVGSRPNEVIFTGSGSESDNLALKGIILKPEIPCGPRGFCPLTRQFFRTWDRLRSRLRRPAHIVTSRIEHSAVLATCRYLEALGHAVTYVPVRPSGRVDPDDVASAIRHDTRLISIMHANNETGVIQPIEEISTLARRAGITFHTDACQTAGKLALGPALADLVSISAQKLYGPKGVGALIARGVELEPLIHGGAQEDGRRAGTENVPGIVGFGAACALASVSGAAEAVRERGLRDRLLHGLLQCADVRINGDREHLLPGTVNVSFRHIRGDALATALAMEGIAVSTGSACHSGGHSHVLEAMGVPAEWLHGAVRFTLGRTTTINDVDYVLHILPSLIARLVKASPLALAS